jgi:hypothetical protein
MTTDEISDGVYFQFDPMGALEYNVFSIFAPSFNEESWPY